MVIEKTLYVLKNDKGVIGAFFSRDEAEESKFLNGGKVRKRRIDWTVKRRWIG